MSSDPKTPADVFRRVDDELAQRERLVERVRPIREQKRALEAGISSTYVLIKDVITQAVRDGVLRSQEHYDFGGFIYYVRPFFPKNQTPGQPDEFTVIRADPIFVDEE